MQPNRRNQTERPPQKVHMPPAVIDIGLQRDNHHNGHHKAPQQQDAKARFAVAQRGERARYDLPTHRRASDSAYQQSDWRRGYRKPNRDVVPRRCVRPVYLAHKQILYNERMLRQLSQALNKPQRIFPIVRVNDIHDRQRRRRKYPARRQDALALRPTRRLPQIYPAHSQYHRQQHQPKHAQIHRQAHHCAAQRKRPKRIPAKSAVSQIQRD